MEGKKLRRRANVVGFVAEPSFTYPCNFSIFLDSSQQITSVSHHEKPA